MSLEYAIRVLRRSDGDDEEEPIAGTFDGVRLHWSYERPAEEYRAIRLVEEGRWVNVYAFEEGTHLMGTPPFSNEAQVRIPHAVLVDTYNADAIERIEPVADVYEVTE